MCRAPESVRTRPRAPFAEILRALIRKVACRCCQATIANKCQLKPLDRNADYGPLPFTDAQWKKLNAVFPRGVCDYSKPGVEQQGTIPWQTYQDRHGDVIYGGKPLGPAPKSEPFKVKRR